MKKLSEQSCIPCRGGIPPLTPEEIAPLITELSNHWNVIDNHHLERTFSFPDFITALEFVNKTGALAEEEAHHPNITFTWGTVTVSIWSHKIDGLAKSDFILASKLDLIYDH